MFTPEEWKQHKTPTIVLGHAIAECVNPLDETWLALEELLRELLDNEQIIYGDDDDMRIKLGSMWPSS